MRYCNNDAGPVANSSCALQGAAHTQAELERMPVRFHAWSALKSLSIASMIISKPLLVLQLSLDGRK